MKSKYTKIFIVCTLVGSLLMGSCTDFLTEDPRSTKTDQSSWRTVQDASMAVNALYTAGAPNLHTQDIWGGWAPLVPMFGGITSGIFDNIKADQAVFSAIRNSNYNLNQFNDVFNNLYTQYFQGVSRANNTIAGVSGMSDVLTAAQQSSFLAQAKFFRAYNYFELVKNFGDVPYIDFVFTDLSDLYRARTPPAEIYANIEKDLLEAIAVLPDQAFYRNSARISKAAAQTLLAYVYLQWAGYPLNGGAAYYTKAANMAKAVMPTGGSASGHALIHPTGTTNDLNSAYNLIRLSKPNLTEAVPEIIYAREFNHTTLNIGSRYHIRSVEESAMAATGGWIGGGVLYNGYAPAALLLESYLANDIRIQEKQFFFWKLEYVRNGEPRILELGETGNWFHYDAEAIHGGRNSDQNIPIFRYADVLLIAAEGLARTGGDAEARDYLNQVRTRAGVPAEMAATGNDLVNIILTERLQEFPLEFRIWDDIRRTRLYPEADGVNSGRLKWTPLAQAAIQNKPQGATKVGAIPEYALLWTFPLREIQANPLLTPNPGWSN